jgi:hypothetical protein
MAKLQTPCHVNPVINKAMKLKRGSVLIEESVRGRKNHEYFFICTVLFINAFHCRINDCMKEYLDSDMCVRH